MSPGPVHIDCPRCGTRFKMPTSITMSPVHALDEVRGWITIDGDAVDALQAHVASCGGGPRGPGEPVPIRAVA